MKIPAPCSRAILVFLAAAGIAGCGGGSSDGDGGGPLNITTTAADDGVIGAAYSETVVATGGQGSKTFSISVGALPTGLALSAGGVISGTPAGPPGTASFTVSVSDSAAMPATDTQPLTIDIVEPLSITTAALTDTAVGDDYDVGLAAAGGTAPYTFSVASGDLPAGVSLSAAGLLSGTVAATAVTESFTLQVADSSTPQLTATQSYTVRVTLEIATAVLADATGGISYSDALVVRGGLPPYEWSLLAGSLPAGLSGPDAATGQFSGTPDAVCASTTSSLTVQVTDSDVPAATDMRAGIDLMLLAQALEFTTAALPNATIGGFYSERIFASGGVPPYTFAITGGALPSQLALNANNGRITGTPDTVETQGFEVSVTDICPETASRDLSIAVVAASLGRNDSIATATVLPGNGNYQASISPSGHPNTVLDPDEDYYAITTTAMSTITVDINAEVNDSPLDSVIEILASNGAQLNTCTSPAFNSACEHDDENTQSGQLDSFLQVRVPGGTTIFIHVVDWGSNARPDKLYNLIISGVN